MDKPDRRRAAGVVSIGIVCYRNWDFLTQAIDSVLMQDYKKIQLIVSDDGSDGFPAKRFETYIQCHKRENVISYIVRQSKKNEGTVRHLNHVIDQADGDYLMFMAADDALDNASVLSRYVTAFQKEGSKCGAVMAQTALFDRNMKQLLGYFVWPDVAEAINTSDQSDDLLKLLYMYPVVPTTSICVQRWVFEKYGKFNTEYSLIEDYPFHLLLARNRVPMRYLNFVAARHRDGGISHGAVTALSASKKLYLTDCIHARQHVLDHLEGQQVDPMVRSYNLWQVRSNQHMLLTTGTGLKGKLAYARLYPWETVVACSRRVQPGHIIRCLQLLGCMLFLLVFASPLHAALAGAFPGLAGILHIGIIKGAVIAITGLLLVFIVFLFVMLEIKKRHEFPIELLS